MVLHLKNGMPVTDDGEPMGAAFPDELTEKSPRTRKGEAREKRCPGCNAWLNSHNRSKSGLCHACQKKADDKEVQQEMARIEKARQEKVQREKTRRARARKRLMH